jgi:hypothetical protein
LQRRNWRFLCVRIKKHPHFSTVLALITAVLRL